MKVTDSAITNASTARAGAAAPARSGSAAQKVGWGGEGGDRVDLSALSGKLLERLRGMDGPEHAERLERLSALVRSGNYSPDPVKIARKMVEDALGTAA